MRSSPHARPTRASVLPLAALLLAVTGCNDPGHHYLVEMTPASQGLERRVSIWGIDSTGKRVPAQLEADEADRFARAYGVRPDSFRHYAAQGRFDDIPEDLGNVGVYRTVHTLLGSSSVYVERFRGNPRPAEIVARPGTMADSVFGLVRLWCSAEVGSHPGWPALESHLEAQVHAPLRDWASAEFLRDRDRSLQMPLWNVLYEHPELFGLLTTGMDPEEASIPFFSPRSARDTVRARFGRALGVHTPAESHRVLGFLESSARAETSLARSIGGARNLDSDDALELWTSTVHDAYFEANPVGWLTDSLELRLETHSEPYETDGTWDEETGLVTWHTGIPGPHQAVVNAPFHCRASWTVPDSAQQMRLFGRILLHSERLANYCSLFMTLDPAHQREWERMLSHLAPGKLRPLERFHFADARRPRSPEDDDPAGATEMAEMILRAARPRTDESDD